MPFTFNKDWNVVALNEVAPTPITPTVKQAPIAAKVKRVAYPEVPEVYYNSRLDPKNFLEG
jgi:hypothetical protein